MIELILITDTGAYLEKLKVKNNTFNYLVYRGRLFIRIDNTNTFKQQPYLEVF